MQIDPTKIPGWGVDRRPERRPGVPMEQPARGAGAEPPPQPAPEPVVKSVSVSRMPAVFGTAVPPRGLSGVMRRAAYQIPEHRARHWLLLLLADRVDVWEGRLEDLLQPRNLAIAAAGLAAVTLFLTRRRR